MSVTVYWHVCNKFLYNIICKINIVIAESSGIIFTIITKHTVQVSLKCTDFIDLFQPFLEIFALKRLAAEGPYTRRALRE